MGAYLPSLEEYHAYTCRLCGESCLNHREQSRTRNLECRDCHRVAGTDLQKLKESETSDGKPIAEEETPAQYSAPLPRISSGVRARRHSDGRATR